MNQVKIDTDAIFEAHPFAEFILGELESKGHEAVLIGGIVRDAVLAMLEPQFGFEPVEVDIATSASPSQIKELFGEYKLLEIGEAFGVIMIRSPEGLEYEVATFRSESDYDGRRPGQVEHVLNLEDDVNRRDFTVNGLAATRSGDVIDLVNGVEDLDRRQIRTIGDPEQRFAEDYLRMLRAARFSCRLDAVLDEEAAAAIKSNAPLLDKISAERIQAELIGIFATARSADGIELLDKLDLLEVILPELSECKGVPQPAKYHPEGDVYTHSILALRIADSFITDPLLKLAVLLHDIGKPSALEQNDGVNMAGHDRIGADMAEKICRRLRFSNDDVRFITSLILEHQRIGQFPQMSTAKQVRFIKHYEHLACSVDNFPERFGWLKALIQLMIADCQASAMKSDGWLNVLKSIAPLLIQIEEIDKLTGANALINGTDLIAMGMEKGPAIGVILDQLYELIYSGKIDSREAALEQAKQMISDSKLD